MVRFGKAADYALLALMFLVEHGATVASARQMAEALRLPLPLLSKILKSLHHNGLLQSTRGSRGGYRIAVDLRQVSLQQLLGMLRTHRIDQGPLPADAPLLALQVKLEQALRDVKLSDLVIPGRRIDVPVGSVGRPRRSRDGIPTAAAVE